MNRPPEFERLLDDVLAEKSTEQPGLDPLGGALREARHRRRRRLTRNTAAALGLALLLSFLAWTGRPVSEQLPTGTALAYQPVATRPMDGSCVVHTRRFGGVVRTDRLFAVAAVRTVPGRFRLLDDEQLLQLVSPHTAFLVGQGASERLVFLNPSDRDGFPTPGFQ